MDELLPQRCNPMQVNQQVRSWKAGWMDLEVRPPRYLHRCIITNLPPLKYRDMYEYVLP